MFFFSFFLLALLPAMALADVLNPSPTTRTAIGSNPEHIVTRSLIQVSDKRLNNAQRLARGLPPNRPARRHGLQPRQSSTCRSRPGIIRVTGGPSSGFLSRLANEFGEYQFTPDESEAIIVSICQESGSSTFDITTQTGLEKWSNLGAVVGFESTSNDLGASANYAYIVATEQVPRGPAVPGSNAFSASTGSLKDIESNIWTLSASEELLASWVNTDGSVPDVKIVYVPSTGAFAITGDVDTFRDTFGDASVVSLVFEPNA